ncbi:hypothetical protein F5J12DRAFT_691269, partial [Pisolithus orientalis]|uniref:uncharacterized protein n=1 Tax=Pisolithus orientalis TaxID=936130 RepID=UPI0022245D6E
SCWDIQKSQSLWQICPAHMHQHMLVLILFIWNQTDNQGYRGSVVLLPDKTHILISNLMTGLDLYPVGHSVISLSFPFPCDSSNGNYPCAIDFVDCGQKVVSGATDGKVWVWCMRTGTQVQTLHHGSVMVQVLCGFQGRNYNFLATSAAGHSMCMTIKLWKAK